MKIGYARVSTREQNADFQIEALKNAGCEKVYKAVAGGAKTTHLSIWWNLSAIYPR